MVHKIVTLKKRDRSGHDSPYVSTEVLFSRSLVQIKELLDRYGCEKILEFTEKRQDLLYYSLAFENRGVKFLVEFPITYLAGNPSKLSMNVSGRIIYNKIKALLVDVEINYLDFNQAMVPFMLLPTPSGQPVTATDILTIEDAEVRARQVRLMISGGA